MISFNTRALLLVRRPPCWNKHGAARTTGHVSTRTPRRACRVVTQQVEFGLIRCLRVTPAAGLAGAAVELAASRKEERYANIDGQYLFAPIAVETLYYPNTSACQLFANLGSKISSTSGDERKGAFLFCREFRCWCNATTLSCYIT